MWQQTEDTGCPRPQVHQSVPSGRIGKEIGKVWPETLVIHQMERPISAPSRLDSRTCCTASTDGDSPTRLSFA